MLEVIEVKQWRYNTEDKIINTEDKIINFNKSQLEKTV